MTRENSNKLSKREQVKRFNKKAEANLKKKKNDTSDSDDGNGGESENEMDMHELRKYIKKIFPSKHMDKKIKAGEKLKKLAKNYNSDKYDETREEEWNFEDSEEEETEEEEEKPRKKKSKNKKIDVSDDETISLGSQDTESEEEEEDYEEENVKPNKYNIIFTFGSPDDEEWETEDEYDGDYEDYENSQDDTEDEDEDVSSVDSDEEEEQEEAPNKKSSKKGKIEEKPKKKNKRQKIPEENLTVKDEVDKKVENKNEVLEKLKELLEKNPNDKSIKKCIETYEDDIKNEKKRKEKKEKKQKEKNMRIFRKIVRDKNTMNDFAFYEKLELEHQKKLIKELREINKITRIEKPYKMTLLESDIPIQFKAAAIKKINSLKYMEPGSGEFYKIKNWVDTFMKIPFTEFRELPISIENGVEQCHEFMANAQKTLDDAVYGLNDAKMQIMQMLGQLLTNPKAIGTAIAIHGPPGTGKTSLVKEGISKILNRPFAFIALGGATDSSFLEGHGYTYEGSTWGKIVQILIDSKCMNPVIYFDELDKISDTPRGEEIAGILTHLTDTSQNSQFHDKYFAEINFDLSKCLFIFSYNDESKVNPILKDRMYRIKTKGYSGKEKAVIANNYLLPRIREQVKFNEDDIIITPEALSYINETHCCKEDGVRNMKRCLEIIHTKLNLYRLMRPNSNLFEGDMSLNVEFPFKVTKDIVDKLIKKESDGLETWRALYN
jgi:ATP-dependent Lon protease